MYERNNLRNLIYTLTQIVDLNVIDWKVLKCDFLIYYLNSKIVGEFVKEIQSKPYYGLFITLILPLTLYGYLQLCKT